MNLKKFVLKVVRVIISMTIEFQDFDLDNILIGKKSYGNVLVYGFYTETWLVWNHCALGLIK